MVFDGEGCLGIIRDVVCDENKKEESSVSSKSRLRRRCRIHTKRLMVKVVDSTANTIMTMEKGNSSPLEEEEEDDDGGNESMGLAVDNEDGRSGPM